MGPNLKGQVCVVTGASRDIGKGISVQLGAAEAKVYVTGRSKKLLQECAAEIREKGGIAVPVQLDHKSRISFKETKEFKMATNLNSYLKQV